MCIIFFVHMKAQYVVIKFFNYHVSVGNCILLVFYLSNYSNFTFTNGKLPKNYENSIIFTDINFD